MEKNDILIFIALFICAISIMGNIFFMCKKPVRRFYTVQIDAPTVNVWQEVVAHEHLDDDDRDFDIKYDLIDEKDAKCK